MFPESEGMAGQCRVPSGCFSSATTSENSDRQPIEHFRVSTNSCERISPSSTLNNESIVMDPTRAEEESSVIIRQGCDVSSNLEQGPNVQAISHNANYSELYASSNREQGPNVQANSHNANYSGGMNQTNPNAFPNLNDVYFAYQQRFQIPEVHPVSNNSAYYYPQRFQNEAFIINNLHPPGVLICESCRCHFTYRPLMSLHQFCDWCIRRFYAALTIELAFHSAYNSGQGVFQSAYNSGQGVFQSAYNSGEGMFQSAYNPDQSTSSHPFVNDGPHLASTPEGDSGVDSEEEYETFIRDWVEKTKKSAF